MDQILVAEPISDDLRLGELWKLAWQSKWLIICLTCALTGAGVVAGRFVVKEYRAEIVISPVSDTSTGIAGGLSGLASQYGALASMAGISMSGKGTKEEAVATLQSELITEAYVRDKNLLPILYFKRWDTQKQRWKSDDPLKIPTLWKANQYFKKSIREIKQEKQSGLVTMRIKWRDAVAAANWANDLVRVTNQYMREKAIQESERDIAYLNEQAAKTDVVEARTAIYSILKEEVTKEMIAKGREEYGLKVIDPARAPEVSSSPSSMLLGFFGFLAGLLLSAFVIWRKSLVLAQRSTL